MDDHSYKQLRVFDVEMVGSFPVEVTPDGTECFWQIL